MNTVNHSCRNRGLCIPFRNLQVKNENENHSDWLKREWQRLPKWKLARDDSIAILPNKSTLFFCENLSMENLLFSIKCYKQYYKYLLGKKKSIEKVLNWVDIFNGRMREYQQFSSNKRRHLNNILHLTSCCKLFIFSRRFFSFFSFCFSGCFCKLCVYVILNMRAHFKRKHCIR